MTDLARQMERARSSLRVDWSEERERLAERGFLRKKRAQPIKRALAGGTLALLLGVALFAAERHPADPPMAQARQEISRRSDGSLQFADGSTARLMDTQTELRAEASPGRVSVELVRGAARFEVVHRTDRLFRVEAGPVAIEDRGTRFTVERLDSGVRVRVEEGAVAVFDPKGESALKAGQEGLFVFPQQAPARPAAAPARHPARRGWKSLAGDGEFEAAWKELGPAGMKSLRDQPEELMLAADVARLSHHSEQAVAPLRTVLERHASDPRASLAAFTLGRVLLEELGRPREAAGAFGEAQRLAPKGPMAEDALAREVEAWSRAGQASLARERAELYQERYPDGLRLRTVRVLGGLE